MYLTNKWRPHQLNEVIGQESVVSLLRQYFNRGLRLPIILNGPYGCGKTTLSHIIARHYHPEYNTTASHAAVISINAANKTGVKDIEVILETVKYQPITGTTKVYLIDEAHLLSKPAFNSFLEVLEFLPNTVRFVFATTDKDKIPEAILSRCLVLNLTHISPATLTEHLVCIAESENIGISKECIAVIARHSQGSARDAVKYLEQTAMLKSNPSVSDIESLLHIPPAELVEQVLNKIATGDYDFKSLSSAAPVNFLTELICRIQERSDLYKWIPVLQAITEHLEVVKYGVHSHHMLNICLAKATYVYQLAEQITTPISESVEHEVLEFFPDAQRID